jgi:hypothetical protein
MCFENKINRLERKLGHFGIQILVKYNFLNTTKCFTEFQVNLRGGSTGFWLSAWEKVSLIPYPNTSA